MKDHSLKPKVDVKVDILAGLDEEGLLELRAKIDGRLQLDLEDLDLSKELSLQYRAGKALLNSVNTDESVPANQRSQVFNSVNNMLEKIVKQQGVVFDAERLKRFESSFLRVLEELGTDDARRKFFDLYGEYLQQDTAKEAA